MRMFFLLLLGLSLATLCQAQMLAPDYQEIYSYPALNKDGYYLTLFMPFYPAGILEPVQRARIWKDKEWVVYDVKNYSGSMPEVSLAFESGGEDSCFQLRYSLSKPGHFIIRQLEGRKEELFAQDQAAGAYIFEPVYTRDSRSFEIIFRTDEEYLWRKLVLK